MPASGRITSVFQKENCVGDVLVILQLRLHLPGSRCRLTRRLSGEESTCQYRRSGFDPCVCKIPGEGNGSPFQYCCLENPTDSGAWGAVIHGVLKSQTQLSSSGRELRPHTLWGVAEVKKTAKCSQECLTQVNLLSFYLKTELGH